ncbi:Gfo/Idh/MocA family protein [Rhodococcus koreensis]
MTMPTTETTSSIPPRSGPVGVGVIGAGMISEQYLVNLTRFPDVRVIAVGDIDTGRAKAAAEEWSIPKHGTGADVLSDPDVEIVVNLTLPATHAEVSMQALRAGKHVWSEKPIAIDLASAAELVQLARDLGLRLGVAPDTVLGPGWQGAKRAIEQGAIGTPLSATTRFEFQGPELFHPNAGFLYQAGAGPLFDIGPYYFTALVQMLGPVQDVAANGVARPGPRRLQVGPNAGQEFDVEVPTHLAVLARFEQGPQAQSLLSFDTPLYRSGAFEITGTEGTMVLPDPNEFGSGHRIRIARPLRTFSQPIEQPWETIEIESCDAGRGLGVLDMARAIRSGSEHLATGDIGYHVLDIMASVAESVRRHEFIPVQSSAAPVGTLPEGFDPFTSTVAATV